MMINVSKRVAEMLLDIKAVTFSFTKPYLYTFVSGIKGPMYCDNRRLISYPNKRRVVVDEVVKIAKKWILISLEVYQLQEFHGRH